VDVERPAWNQHTARIAEPGVEQAAEFLVGDEVVD
jgi:hypothetical protein